MQLILVSSRYLYCMKRSRSICRHWSVAKIENKMLLAMCCDLPVKILVDLKTQGSFLTVRKRAASLAFLVVVWGGSLLSVHIELVVDPLWDLQVALMETPETRLCATQGQPHCCQGLGGSRGSWVVLTDRGTSAGPDPALGSPSPGLWPLSFLVEC